MATRHSRTTNCCRLRPSCVVTRSTITEYEAQTLHITWLGHARWRIDIADQVLLIDPWLDGNPLFKGHDRAKAIGGTTAILITHAHGDHASNAESIAQELSVPIACIAELGDIWETAGCKQSALTRAAPFNSARLPSRW